MSDVKICMDSRYIDTDGAVRQMLHSACSRHTNKDGRGKKLYYPDHLCVADSVLPEMRAEVLSKFRRKVDGINSRRIDAITLTREKALAARESAREMYCLCLENNKEMTVKPRILMSLVPKNARDFSKLMNDPDFQHGTMTCSITPVHLRKMQKSPDGKVSLKPNRQLKERLIATIPHCTPGRENNNSKKVWMGPDFSHCFNFFFGHYSQYYDMTANPMTLSAQDIENQLQLGPLDAGCYFAHLFFSTNPGLAGFNQTFPIARGCELLAYKTCYNEFPEADAVLMFKSGSKCTLASIFDEDGAAVIVRLDGKDCYIPHGEWDEQLYANMTGIYHQGKNDKATTNADEDNDSLGNVSNGSLGIMDEAREAASARESRIFPVASISMPEASKKRKAKVSLD